MAVLARAAGLAHKAALEVLDPLADRLAVCDLRTSDIGVYGELAHEAINDDLEV